MTKGFKNIIRQIHLWLGLTSGLIVFIISITGFLYVFEKEIRDYTNKKYQYVPFQEKSFIGLKTIIENYELLEPKQKINSLKINKKDANAAVEITTKNRKTYFFNPYDGVLISTKKSDWLTTVLEIHRNLLLGEIGKSITGWSVIVFIVILLTGLVLWFPNQTRLIKQSLKIKWSGSSKRINYDMHQVLGFYASIFLIVIAFTGIYYKYDPVKKTISVITGDPLRKGDKVSSAIKNENTAVPEMYNAIYENANLNFPGSHSIVFSIRKAGELRVRMIYPSYWARRMNTIFYDAQTGQMLSLKLYKDNNSTDLYDASNRDLHTGAFFGILGKIIWSLASLIGASLPITGFIIWWNKRKKSKPLNRVSRAS